MDRILEEGEQQNEETFYAPLRERDQECAFAHTHVTHGSVSTAEQTALVMLLQYSLSETVIPLEVRSFAFTKRESVVQYLLQVLTISIVGDNLF